MSHDVVKKKIIHHVQIKSISIFDITDSFSYEKLNLIGT